MGKRNFDYSRNTSSASLEKANMSDTNSDSDTELTPPEISAKALEVSNNLLPHKSRKMYEKLYLQFMDWRNTKSLFECITLEVKKYIVAERYNNVWKDQYSRACSELTSCPLSLCKVAHRL
ncbi:hypothetical protein C0J52_11067 [Blattella germanica]|nr:hypothetical protein C0J52_11067 [Blattella germanica]